MRLGRGDGTFGASTGYATVGVQVNSVTLGDLNGDGILDLVTVGYGGGATVRLGNGNGTFGNSTSYATEDIYSLSVILGDLNGDGNLDLITAGYGASSGQVSVRLGKGDGTFGGRSSFSIDSSNYVSGVNTGDLNGDGVLDIVTASYGGMTGTATTFLATTQDGRAPLLDFSLKTKADALQAMGMLDRMLTNLAKQRGTIGASQTRVTTAISNLQTARENFTAAESRIKDADIASDSANLTRTQILQQAGAAVLAQSNLTPQLALKLLS